MSNWRENVDLSIEASHKGEVTIRIGGDLRDRFNKLFKMVISKKGIPLDDFRTMLDKLNDINESAKPMEKINRKKV